MHDKFQILCQFLISTLKDTEEPTGHQNVTGQTLSTLLNTEQGKPHCSSQGGGVMAEQLQAVPILIVYSWVSHVKAGNN